MTSNSTSGTSTQSTPPAQPVLQNGGQPGVSNPKVPNEVPKSKGLELSAAYWETLQFATSELDRDEKLALCKQLAGLLGATVKFPDSQPKAGAEKTDQSSKKNGKKTPSRPRKPVNERMKDSPEEKALHAAQKALRAKRLGLGLPKGTKDDPRLKAEIEALKAAQQQYKAKKEAVQKSN